MSETILHVFIHTAIDTVKMLPFLFFAYLLIGFLEHRSGNRLEKALTRSGKLGPLAGAALGVIPQCGFSVAVANFYSSGLITAGTLAAVFLSTSDEAVPILFAYPDQYGTIVWLLVIKVILAIIAGILIDRFFIKPKQSIANAIDANKCKESHCHHGILKPAVIRTLQVFIFLLIISFILHLLIEGLGEERIGALFLQDSAWQPVVAAIVGFIPNCATSVLLTQLYLEGGLSFGAVIAGLSTNAGLGLLVLLKTNRPMKDNFYLMGLLFLFAVSAGLLLQLFPF